MVTITEPVTMLTDYLITIFCTVFVILILGQTSNPAAYSLAGTLLVTGLGAFLGGSSHGFKENLSETTDARLWKSSTLTIGLGATLFFVSAVLSSLANQFLIYLLIVIAVIEFLGYAYWMSSHDDFYYVIVNYAALMVIVLILKLISWLVYDEPSSLWLIGGVLVTFIASAFQALKIGIHPKYFNHNDVFHIIQLAGLFLVYQAALVITMID